MGSPATTVVTDSAGVEIVEAVPPEEGEADGWRVEVEPAVTIGVTEGEDPYQFTSVQGAGWIPDGRIYVADWGPHRELRTFDGDGRFLEAWGGGGQGPGEFAMPPLYALPYRGDSVAMVEVARISIFDSEGGFGRRLAVRDHFPPSPDRSRLQSCCTPRAALPDGSFLVEYPEEGPISGGGVRGEVRVVRVGPEGELIGEVGRFPGGRWYSVTSNEGARAIRGTYTGHFRLAAVGERILATDNVEYRIDEVDGDGRLHRSIRIQRERPILGDEVRRAREEVLESGTGVHALTRQQVDERLELLPDHLPAFDRVLVDPDERIWLVSSAVGSSSREHALVLDSAGEILGEVEFPSDVWVFEVGAEEVIGVTEDELSVPRVVVHRIVR